MGMFRPASHQFFHRVDLSRGWELDEFGGGRWIQVEGLVAWNFKADTSEPPMVAADSAYTANVTRNALDGIMGFRLPDRVRAGTLLRRAPRESRSGPCPSVVQRARPEQAPA